MADGGVRSVHVSAFVHSGTDITATRLAPVEGSDLDGRIVHVGASYGPQVTLHFLDRADVERLRDVLTVLANQR